MQGYHAPPKFETDVITFRPLEALKIATLVGGDYSYGLDGHRVAFDDYRGARQVARVGDKIVTHADGKFSLQRA